MAQKGAETDWPSSTTRPPSSAPTPPAASPRALGIARELRNFGFREVRFAQDFLGVGLIAGLEIVQDKATKASYPPEAKAGALMVEKGIEAGFLTRPLPSDTLGVCPPLIITEPEIDVMFDRIAQALDATKAALDRL